MQDTDRETKPVFLIVDDDPIIRRLVARGLEELHPAAILEVEDGLQAQPVLREQSIDVVITDVLMPNMDGLELMSWAQENCPGPLWIVLSGLDTFDAAVDALHRGAFDFLSKPPTLQHVKVAVRNALDRLELSRDRQRLYGELAESHDQLAEKVQQLQTVCHMLEDQARVIQSDLARAETIQRALLPQVPPKIGSWCVEALYRPGSNVGGDYYDVIDLDDHYLGIVIADAAGHGVAAAMLSVLFKHRLQLIDEDSKSPLSPSDVLSRVNKKLFDDMTGPGMFITAIYALLDKHNGRLRLASAGHTPSIRVGHSDRPQYFKRTGPALGLEFESSYGEDCLSLEQHDRLLFFTDGVLEGDDDPLTVEKLAISLADPTIDRGDLLREYYSTAIRCVAGRDRDDITMVLLERSAGESHFDSSTVEQQNAEQTAPTPNQAQLLQGHTTDRGYMSIAGTGTWTGSVGFYDVAVKLLKQRKRLTIDLGDCEYLDSTFLGTLYEIATSKAGKVTFQRVSESIMKLFKELDMSGVIKLITPNPETLPDSMNPLYCVKKDVADQSLRVLKAHEILASLSDENQEQFRGVVESLRADLKIDEPAAP